MIAVLDHDSALEGYTGPGTTWVNDIFCYESYPNAGSIAQPVDHQFRTLPLSYGCPLVVFQRQQTRLKGASLVFAFTWLIDDIFCGTLNIYFKDDVS